MPNETALAQQEPLQPAVRRYALKTSAPPRKGLVDYDRDLSEEQRAVALCDPRPTLVIAGAGSGKTRALTFRVAHLLETGTAPETILLLTFTNKAAREMVARVGQLCRVETRRMWGGTFHHVAHGLLREHASRLGYADRFGLLDREDAKEVMASATADLGYGVGQRRFPRPDAMIDLYSTAVNTQRPLAEVIAVEAPQFVALEEEILRVARRFAERKAQMNAMDFDDLLLNWKRLLIEVPGARESICRRFSAVLVDEYQDTNRLQGEIVDAVAAPHGNLLVVGDDAQSIYAFRGAHFENILKFPERYPQCQHLRLITNYRSTPPILALANASIRCNRKQFEKELRTHRDSLTQLVPPKARSGLRALAGALQILVAMRSQPSEMIRCILHEGGYGEALKQRYANAQARHDDVLQLADYALQAESLEQLLADLTLLDSLEAEDVVEGAEPDEKLTLSSVHQAKGLEWRAVFLIWLADGRFPSAPALRAPNGEEEERRLFYVAVTRAKDELYLTYPRMTDKRYQARLLLRPSRFLDELPAAPPPYEKWSIEVAPDPKMLAE